MPSFKGNSFSGLPNLRFVKTFIVFEPGSLCM